MPIMARFDRISLRKKTANNATKIGLAANSTADSLRSSFLMIQTEVRAEMMDDAETIKVMSSVELEMSKFFTKNKSGKEMKARTNASCDE